MLEGSLKDFSLYELMQIISLGEKTGKLILTDEGNKNKGIIYFKNGRVEDAEIKGYTGEVAIINILSVKEGFFKFIDCSIDGTKQSINKSVPELIIFATSKVDEWEKIKEKIHSVNSIFKLSSKDIPEEIHLTPLQWKIMYSLGGKNLTIKEAALKLKMSEIDVAKEVYSLVTLRILREVGEKDPDESNIINKKSPPRNFIIRLMQRIKRL